MIVFLGLIFPVSVISFVVPCIVYTINNPKCARCSEEEHVDDNKVFVGKEIRHALDGKPHLCHRVQHHDVEEDEQGDLQEVICLNVKDIHLGVARSCHEQEKDDFDHCGVVFMALLRFLELAHFSGKVFQLLGAEQNMLVLALLDDPIELFVVELGAFLEHGQSESGLYVAPVEEPVVQEESRVCRPYNPPILCIMFVSPTLLLTVC